MVGQGSPNTGHMPPARNQHGSSRLTLRLAMAVWFALGAGVLSAAEPALMLRIGFGGGAERQWHGDVSIDQGSLSIVRPLGILADSPGSIWAASENTVE